MKRILLSLFSIMLLLFSTDIEAQLITLGTGTSSTTGTQPSPNNCYYRNHRIHYLYKASEINAAGVFNQNWINSIAFKTTGLPNNPLPGYSVKISQVPASTNTISNFNNGTFTQVYTNSSQTFSMGWNTFTFTSPFLWDGVSNIVVEVCWNIFNTPLWSSTGTVEVTTMNNHMAFFRSDGTSACPNTSTSSFPIMTTRPNCRFDMSPYLLPCTGPPSAGTLSVNPILPCVNKPFTINMNGHTLATNLVYDWQSAPVSNPTNFSTIPGSSTTQDYYSSTFLTPAHYRVIVTCPTNNLSDTSAPIFVDSGSFYVCYCDPAFTSNGSGYFIDSIGIAGTSLAYGSSGKGPNGYTKVNHFLPNGTAVLQQSQNYNITVQRGTSSSANHSCGMWIDYDQSGTFDPSEFTLIQAPFFGFYYTKNFSVPSGLQPGQTGMRIIFASGALDGTMACATNLVDGEVEDYVVEISLPPCTSPSNTGTAYSIDSAVCDGTDFMLVDTGHAENQIGLSYGWQSSTDNINWSNVAGANNDTLITNIAQPTWFRFVVYCNGTPSFSNSTKVELFPSFACYCPSRSANFGEVSDIGAVKFGTYVLMAPGGSHLRNPLATAKYTSQLNRGIIQAQIDSSYKLAVYHVLRDSLHNNAKVTMFIDLDRDGQFTNAERLYSGVSTQTNYYLSSMVDIPATASPGLTGFRVILNENTAPNSPSDDGCGIYGAGETEDYLVELYHDVTSISNPDMGIEHFSIYPIPASNALNFIMRIDGTESFTLSLTDMTGKLLYSKDIKVHDQYVDVLNIESLADGVYSLNVQNDKGEVQSERFTVQKN